MHARIGVRGGGGGAGWAAAPWNFANSHFRAKNHVIFGQNQLIFGQAMEKSIRATDPPHENGPVRLCREVGGTSLAYACTRSCNDALKVLG